MHRFLLAALAAGALSLTALPATAMPSAAPNTIQSADNATVLVHGHGHHYGWGRGRGHHYGWGRGRHRGWHH